MRKLAIVILNWNGAGMLHKYLGSVIANSTVGDVIVADNASTDNSLEVLNAEFPDVPQIILDKNYGFAEGYNRALGGLADKYEYLLLLNSDVEIRQKGWDKVMTDYMDTHEECAACQPKLLSLLNPDQFEYAGAAGGMLDKYGYPFCRGRILGTVEKDKGQYDDVSPLLWATGAALLVRSSDWQKSGGLDGGFFAHMEEIDLCWRLRIMGRNIVCIPQSTAYHLGGGALNYGNPRKTFLNFRNNLLMLYKNLPDAELKSTMRVRAMLDLVAALQFILKGEFDHFKAVMKARKEFKRLIPEYSQKREWVQKNRRAENVKERTDFSILLRYYLMNKKTYTSIK